LKTLIFRFIHKVGMPYPASISFIQNLPPDVVEDFGKSHDFQVPFHIMSGLISS